MSLPDMLALFVEVADGKGHSACSQPPAESVSISGNEVLALDDNSAERAMKPVASECRNWTIAPFHGLRANRCQAMESDGGRKAMAVAYMSIETATMDSVELQAWLANVIIHIA